MGSNRKLGAINRVHMIGIGGSGMLGIASILLKKGFKVSGSDVLISKDLKNLEKEGAQIQEGHKPNLIKDSQIVVYSSAIKRTNPELIEAKARNLIVVPRAQMLSSIITGYRNIAIAGSHGKTTTTSLVAEIFTRGKKDPTYVVGGKILSGDKSSNLGKGDTMIFEADESDGSFSHFHPDVALVTNVDNDHLAFYKNDINNLYKAFKYFLSNMPFYGYAIINGDDRSLRKILKTTGRKFISVGYNSTNDFMISDLKTNQKFQFFKIKTNKNKIIFSLKTPLFGKHNALNASLAAITALEEGIDKNSIKSAIADYKGASRRFEESTIKITNKKIILIDDYGHHPTEINATLEAIKQKFRNKKICMFFEPHRFTRTQQLFKEFAEVLAKISTVYIFPIYPASEKPIRGITSARLVEQIKKLNGNAYEITKNEVKGLLPLIASSYDLILVQGAGTIADIAKLIREYE